MTKPWEETWTAAEQDGPDCWSVWHGETLRVADVRDEARAKLAAAAPEMARLLLGLEWVDMDERRACPACLWPRDEGHEPGCRLVAVLRKAGVVG